MMKSIPVCLVLTVGATLIFSYLSRRCFRTVDTTNKKPPQKSEGGLRLWSRESMAFGVVVFLTLSLIGRLDLIYFFPLRFHLMFGDAYRRFLEIYPYIVMFFAASLLVLSGTIVRAHLFYRKHHRYIEHYLIKTKNRNILPLTSAYYATVSFFIILIGLSVVESTSDYADWLKEEDRINNGMWSLRYMAEDEMYSEDYLGYFENGYPLMQMRGTPVKTEKNLRILAVGDSFVWGSGNTNVNYLWWKQLEREMTKRGYPCTVYAVGFGGTSTYDQLDWLQNTSVIEDIDPHIIIMGYVVNDAQLPQAESNPKAWLNFSDVVGIPITDILSGFFPSVFQTLKYKITDKFADYPAFNNDRIGYQYKGWMLQLVGEDHLRRFEQQVIVPLGNFVDSIDVPILLFTTPEIPDKEFYRSRYEPILPLYAKAGLKVYDSLDYYEQNYSDEKYSAGYYINPVDGHPGPVPNRAYAEYMANVLESEYPQLLGTKAEDVEFLIEVNDWIPYSLSTKPVTVEKGFSEYMFVYPEKSAEKSFLFLPAKKDYVKLNFRYPVDIDEVVISGDNLKSATLFVTGIYESLGYDDQTMYKLGTKAGVRCEWKDTKPLYVTSLCIHAHTINGQAARLSVSIAGEEGGILP